MSPRAPRRRDDEAQPPPQSLLHNMSCRPNVTLQRRPAPVMRLVEIAVPVALPGERREGIDIAEAVWARIEAPEPRNRVAQWLGQLGLPVPATPAACERALAERLRQAAASVGLPPVVALVDAHGDPMPGLSDRLDVVLAVIAKSSGGAFVARGEPVLARLFARSRATLALPFSWRPLP